MITLIILTVLGVFSRAEYSLVSSGINTVFNGLFQLTAGAAAGIGTQSREELEAETADPHDALFRYGKQRPKYGFVQRSDAPIDVSAFLHPAALSGF